jgi:hypothetical protein
MPWRFEVIKNRLPEIRRQLPAIRQQIADETAQDWAVAATEQIIANDQIDSGALANSPYTTSVSGSGYAAVASAVRGRNPEVELLPEVPAPPAGQAAVAIAVGHGAPQNYGTTRLPARPFWEPARELTRQRFRERLAGLQERIR